MCDINADDIAWLSHLVGINLNNSQPAAELPIETTAERLSRLYHTSEQVKIGSGLSTLKPSSGTEYNARCECPRRADCPAKHEISSVSKCVSLNPSLTMALLILDIYDVIVTKKYVSKVTPLLF